MQRPFYYNDLIKCLVKDQHSNSSSTVSLLINYLKFYSSSIPDPIRRRRLIKSIKFSYFSLCHYVAFIYFVFPCISFFHVFRFSLFRVFTLKHITLGEQRLKMYGKFFSTCILNLLIFVFYIY